ncbi:MAG: DUF63 family protein [Haloferacaceae archaeon]
MVLLPEGVVPPLPYLLVLAVAVAVVGTALFRRSPEVSERIVVSLAPWMLVGSSLHVLYGLDALPPAVAPFAGTGAVYATVAVVAGATWTAALALGRDRDVPRVLAATGLVLLVPVVAAALAVGLARGTTRLFWPGVALVAAVVLGAVVWTLLSRLRPDVAVTGRVGVLVVFAHALDGVSTAVGVDVLPGFGERTPLSRFILEFAAGLPTADAIGAGWLFVLVKVTVAAALVAMLTEYVREEPSEGYLLLGLVAAVGLGPGAYNLLLFAAASG